MEISKEWTNEKRLVIIRILSNKALKSFQTGYPPLSDIYDIFDVMRFLRMPLPVSWKAIEKKL